MVFVSENKQGPMRSPWIPILEGLIIGILLTGIVLAVILTIWLKPKMNTTISTSTIVGSMNNGLAMDIVT